MQLMIHGQTLIKSSTDWLTAVGHSDSYPPENRHQIPTTEEIFLSSIGQFVSWGRHRPDVAGETNLLATLQQIKEVCFYPSHAMSPAIGLGS